MKRVPQTEKQGGFFGEIGFLSVRFLTKERKVEVMLDLT